MVMGNNVALGKQLYTNYLKEAILLRSGGMERKDSVYCLQRIVNGRGENAQ